MIAGIAAMLTNLVLNWLLIFGVGPFPVLGIKGAAIATVISRFVEVIIIVVWTHRNKKINPYIVGAYQSFYIPKRILKDILIKGSPLMLNELFWAAGMATITQCYAVRGLEVVASLNISTTISNLFNVVYIHLGGCIAIIVGQHLGAGELDEAKDAQRKMTFFSVVCCAVVALIMMLVGGFFPDLYETEESIKLLAKEFIIISAAVMPICAYCHCGYFTLRSGGKTVVTFLFDSVFTWVIVIPVATILAKFTTLGIVLVFFIVSFLEIIKAIIGFFMVRSGVWVQNIVKESN
jgi:Na+-driven multidrug efflux pump